jgi:hypothetical protein
MELFPSNPAELEMRRRAQAELQEWRSLQAFRVAQAAAVEAVHQSEEFGSAEDEGQLVSA